MPNDLPERATCLIVQAAPSIRSVHNAPEVLAAINAELMRYDGRHLDEWDRQDGACALFAQPAAAVAAACALSRRLAGGAGSASLTAHVRMAIHTGWIDQLDPWGPGSAAERCLGLVALAQEGQTLLTAETAAQIQRGGLPPGASLQPLGHYRLRDLRSVAEVVQLNHAGPAQFPPLRCLESVPNNLPVQMTSFIGRRRQLAELKRGLKAGRMLTLTGSGGSGKTRMALQVGGEVLDQFPDGVWLVDLTALSDPGLVARAAASALKVAEEPGRSQIATLCAAIAARELLLLLDNCEHLITSCARLASTVLAECPHVKIIATSREPLGIAGETAWLVPTLSSPESQAPATLADIMRYEAVRLFVDRARSVSPSFAVTAQNAGDLAAVCSRLDGVPLAIELAAARTRVLSVAQIAERLDDRLRLLSAGSRATLPRHQTLRAAIDWSHDLLSEVERVLWRRLAVFAGGFLLEAAEAVCTGGQIDAADVLDLLSQLVDKSLVVAEEQGGERRFRLLETMRQYGRERLQQAGEEEALRTAHCDWYVGLVERTERELWRADQARWLERVELERDNLRQAVHWAMAAREAGRALRLCGSLWFFWSRGYTGENWGKMLELAAAMACEPGDHGAMAKVLNGAGVFAYYRARFAEAEGYLCRAVTMYRAVGNQNGIGVALNNLGILAQAQGKVDLARQYLEESAQISHALDDPGREAWARSNLSNVYYSEGDYFGARACCAQALAIQRAVGDQAGIAFSNECLGLNAIALGDYTAAEAHLEASIATRRTLGDKRGIGASLAGLGHLALERGDWARCRRLVTESLPMQYIAGDMMATAQSLELSAWLAAAEGDGVLALRIAAGADALRRQLGFPALPARKALIAKHMAPAWAGQSEEAAQGAFAAGSRLPLEALIDLACAPPPDHAQAAAAAAAALPAAALPASAAGLTPREAELVQLLAQGLTTREIGQQLHLSPRTVEKHEENIRTKQGLPNRATLVAWAARKGLREIP